MATLSSDEQIAEFCAAHPRWTRGGDALVGTVRAPTFLKAIAWVDQIAVIAEELDHHPDIDIRWRTLSFRLSTHDSGGITDHDFVLGARIDQVFSN